MGDWNKPLISCDLARPGGHQGTSLAAQITSGSILFKDVQQLVRFCHNLTESNLIGALKVIKTTQIHLGSLST